MQYSEVSGDIAHNKYSIECKYGNQIPGYLASISKPTSMGVDYVAYPFGDLGTQIKEGRQGRFKFLKDGIRQAESYNALIPVLCVKRPNQRGFVVAVRLKDWEAVRTVQRLVQVPLPPLVDGEPPPLPYPLIVKV